MARKAQPVNQALLDELRAELVVDESLPEPLHKQISVGLRRWLARRLVGDRLPPERLMAQVVGVDRTTIKRALRDFVAEGVLIRRVKGTSVARKPDMAPSTPPQPPSATHPFALWSGGVLSEVEPLTLVLFENLPHQRVAWGRLVELYNRRAPGAPIRIVWLPAEVSSETAYVEYVSHSKPDLALLSPVLALRMIRDGLLAPLPEDLLDVLRGPSFHAVRGFERGELLAHALPLHLSGWGFLWNERLVGDISGELPSRIDVVKAVEVVVGLKPSGSGDASLLAVPCELVFAAGIPGKGGRPALRCSFSMAFELYKRLASRRDGGFEMTETVPFTLLKRFLAGSSASYIGPIGQLFNNSPSGLPRFLNGVPLCPVAGQLLPTSCSVVACAGRRTPRTDAALRFMASPEAQVIFPESAVNFSFSTAGDEAMRQHLPAASTEAIKAAIGGHVIDEFVNSRWVPFVVKDIRRLAAAVLERRLESRLATASAIELAESAGLTDELDRALARMRG